MESEEAELAARRFSSTGQVHPHPLPGAPTQAEPYQAPADLQRVVNMAIDLRRPLLLEGEPGAGKTRLAFAVAAELGYPLFEVYVRSTSRADELLYTFDAVRRLYDIQERSALRTAPTPTPTTTPRPTSDATRQAVKPSSYVTLGPLGKAIELSMRGTPSVVLVDEVDKADIDFPNDLLLVLDRLRFKVDEAPDMEFDALGQRTRVERRHFLPIVIITSNREKELPAPFLRRCLYSFIRFPGDDELRRILQRHFDATVTPLSDAALAQFWLLRDNARLPLSKPPGTSELIDWMQLLADDPALNADRLRQVVRPADLPYREALIKKQSDLELLESA